MNRIVFRWILLVSLAAFALPTWAQVPPPPANAPAAPTPAPTATPKAKKPRKTRKAKDATPTPTATTAPDGKTTTGGTPAPPKARSTRSKSSRTKEPVVARTPTRAGDVWVNTESGVYHMPGSEWYGKTKEGAFMSEADAKAKGYRASRSKTFGKKN